MDDGFCAVNINPPVFLMYRWSPAAAARLRKEAREVKQADLVVQTGIPIATLQRILKGSTDPGEERLDKIAEALGVSAQLIMFGSEVREDAIVEVPISDIQVSAGPGRFALDEDLKVGTWPLPHAWVTKSFGDKENLRFVRVNGDSQEPELRDGDLVLIDLGQNRLQEGMHVVSLDDALMIKRVQLEGARLRLKSANTRYDDIVLDLAADHDRFRVIAKAEWTIKAI